jgi:NAD(P)-dependent dehydrogenase (short-subunit alcohol dehydrogenase family)
MKLDGRIAVVTGASRGIGRAIADLFQREGARVAGCARHAAPGVEVCDVSRPEDVNRFAAAVRARFGVPDVVVNNAGTVVRAPLQAVEEREWDEVMGSNLKGTYLVTRAFLGEMRAQGHGRFINIASISGRVGTAGLTAYCAAKHGVVGLTRALAEEVRADGLSVNAICPGSVDTDMLRVGMPGAVPLMTPEQIAQVALFLATDAPPALTGSCVDVFG